MFRPVAMLAGLLALCGPAAADDAKPTADRVAGKWKMVKSEVAPPGAQATVVYNKDGTAVAAVEFMGRKETVKAKWKLDGDKLVANVSDGGKERTTTDTIVKLTDERMVTKDERGKTEEFERVKDDKK